MTDNQTCRVQWRAEALSMYRIASPATNQALSARTRSIANTARYCYNDCGQHQIVHAVDIYLEFLRELTTLQQRASNLCICRQNNVVLCCVDCAAVFFVLCLSDCFVQIVNKHQC